LEPIPPQPLQRAEAETVREGKFSYYNGEGAAGSDGENLHFMIVQSDLTINIFKKGRLPIPLV